MLDLLATIIKPDEFLIALVGHIANDGAAKLAASAVKAFALAAIGIAAERQAPGKEERNFTGRRCQRAKSKGKKVGAMTSRRSRSRKGRR